MIGFGRRELAVPLWLWVAVPLAFILYAVVNTRPSFRGTLLHGMPLFDFAAPDQRFLNNVRMLAVASFTGFLLVDLARRSRVPWYGLPLLFLASLAGAILVASWINTSLAATVQALVGAAIMAAGSRGGSGGLGLALFGALAAVVSGLALAAALAITLASRFLARLPLLTRGALREYGVHLGGLLVWFAVALGGYWLVRSAYGLALGSPATNVPTWLPLTAAAGGACAAAGLQLYLVHRSRRREEAPSNRLRVWAVACLCVLAYLALPGLFGIGGVRAYYDHVRPAMRALHLLPTPVIEIAGYRIDIPFHDIDTTMGPSRPEGGASRVNIRLPAAYGLTSQRYRPSVSIFRRDITLAETSTWWTNRRAALQDMQTREPGQDALSRYPGSTNGLALRTDQYPGIDFLIGDLDPATPWDVAEQTLRRVLQERLHRIN